MREKESEREQARERKSEREGKRKTEQERESERVSQGRHRLGLAAKRKALVHRD